MRNLKRALSLALTAVMVLGMMVIGAGAVSYDDFSDKDKIVNTEAVSTLVELGVIAGKDDGSYDPSGIVTRAEMAKMICVVLNGGKDPQLGTVASYTYSDTVGHWAAAYIEYCTTLGIVAGDGTGKFNPSATVTGAQAAKMLLVAAGYQASIEGFTGANWATSVNVRANQVGLYDGLTINPSEGLSRDSAAQMVYNDLSAKVVTYKYTLVSDGNGGFTSIPTLAYENASGKTDVTVLADKFGVVTVEGTVVANEYADIENGGNALDEGKTTINVTNYNDGQTNFATGDNTFKVSTGAAELGQAVTLYVKPSVTSSGTASKATVIGSVILSDKNKVVTDSSADTLDDSVLDDNKLDANSATKYSFQYGEAQTESGWTSATLTTNLAAWDGVRGVQKTIIDNDDDGIAEYIIFSAYYIGKVTTYTAGDSLKLNSSSSLEFDEDEVVGFDNVAKNDYVLYAVIGGKLHVEEAPSVQGNLDSYNASKSLTVDGTKYSTSKLYAKGTYSNTDWTDANAYTTLDEDAVVYLDKNGYALAVDGTAVANKYAYISGSSYDSLDGARVKVYLADGSSSTYVVDKAYAAGSTTKMTSSLLSSAFGTGNAAGELCTYSINSDNEITVKMVTTSIATAATYEFTKGQSMINAAGTKSYADDSTTFFYVDTSDNVSVYNGIDNAPSVDSISQKYAIITSSGDVKAVLLLDAEPTSDTNFLYIYQTTGTNSNGSIVNAIIDGKLVKDVVVDTDDLGNSLTGEKTGIYKYSVNSKDVYQLDNAPTKTVIGSIYRLTSTSIVVKDTSSNAYEFGTSDAPVALIDGSSTSMDGALAKNQVVAVVYDNDNDALAVYILEEYDEGNANIVSAAAPFSTDKTTTNHYNVEIDFTSYSSTLTATDFVFSGGSSAVWGLAGTYVAVGDTVTVTAKDGTVVYYTFVQS